MKLPLMMALHLLWGVVLWFSISKYGLGVSTDAVQLLFGGQNLAAGNGLTTYDGTFIAFWPPLYPALLALVRLVTGLDILVVAGVVQGLAFLGLGIALSLLFLGMFSGRVLPAAAALLLTQLGEVVVTAAGTVGSDYVHLFLAVLSILLAVRYVESGSRWAFVGLAVAVLLATLQRYLGVAATATAVTAVVAFGRTTWTRRLGNAVVLSLTAVPMLVWLRVTSTLYARRPPITFAENFSWFSRSVLEWFTGPIARKTDLTAETAILWLVILALTATALLLAWHGQREIEKQRAEEVAQGAGRLFVTVLVLYGLFYSLALFGSASMAYFNKLGGRFILPLYVPLMALPAIVAAGLVQAAGRAGRRGLAGLVMAVGGLALVALGAVALRTTIPIVMESHARGVAGGDNAFNNETWRENPAIRYWKSNAPTGEFVLFSNEPDGVAFHTRHAVQPAPRRVTGPYGTNEIPVADFRDELFGPGLDVYLIWIEPSSYDYYYDPMKLGEIAVVESLFGDDLGSVYRLLPKGKD